TMYSRVGSAKREIRTWIPSANGFRPHPPKKQSPMPQTAGVSQSVQPDAAVVQVWTSLPEQRVRPSVHWSLQVAVHAPPEQTSCAPGCTDSDTSAACADAAAAHAWTPLLEQPGAPGVHGSLQVAVQVPPEQRGAASAHWSLQAGGSLAGSSAG